MKFLESNPKYQKFITYGGLIISCLAIIAFLDKILAIGIIFVAFLVGITFLVLKRTSLKTKTVLLFFTVVLLIHIGTVLFVHYAHFQPFSGGYGDYVVYQRQAQEIAQRVHQGNFSLEGLALSHYYPVVIGYIYVLTMPEMLIGQLFGAWLAAISALFVYLIVLEIGASKKQAFLIGLIAAIYPSYLFFGSLLLKETLVIPLVLAGLLLTLKLIKNFFWRNFLIFYIILGAIIHFRFYVGYAVMFTFIPCWLLLSKINLKKKFIYGIIIVFLLGFLPQFSDYGYYGFKTINGFLNQKTITYYREAAYVSLSPSIVEVSETETQASETETQASETTVQEDYVKTYAKKILLKIFPNIEKTQGMRRSSTIEVKTEIDSPPNFLINCSKSFIYVLLGPLPWQIQNYRQLFVLVEIIPWYFLLFFIIKGSFIALKRKRIALPLLVFGIISLGVLALFIANFGIVTRIRIPSFIAFLCLASLGFEKLKYIKIPFLNLD